MGCASDARRIVRAGLLVGLGACTVSDADLSGRPCPCLTPAYVCDEAAGRCVLSGAQQPQNPAVAPFSIRLSSAAATVRLGEAVRLGISIQWSEGARAPIAFTILGGADGIAAEPLTVAAADSEALLVLTANPLAPLGKQVVTVLGSSNGVTAQERFEIEVVGRPGALDTSFGDQGIVHVPVSRMAATTGEGILVIETHPRPVLRRFDRDGKPDLAYGVGGVANPIDSSTFAAVMGMPVVASDWTLTFPTTNMTNGRVMRLASSGTLDATFGVGGLTTYESLGLNGQANVVVLDANEKTLFGGSSANTAIIGRLQKTGAPDMSFGTNGVAAAPASIGTPSRTNRIVVLPDGRVLAVGKIGPYSDTEFLSRLQPNGAPDATFGSNGYRVTGRARNVWSLVLQKSGRVVLVSEAGEAFPWVEGYHQDMTPDVAFGTSGTYALPPADWFGGGMLVLNDDRLVLSLNTQNNSQGVVLVLTPDGLPDESFGDHGRATLPPGAKAHSLLRQANGRLVVGGPMSMVRLWL